MPPFDPQHLQRIREIFDCAAELDGSAREEFLARECGADDGLRRDVETLLKADSKSGDPMRDALAPALEAAAATSNDFSATSFQAGGRVGPYRIVKRLGEGGMGTVYLGERSDGAFQMQVAIKIVRGGGDRSKLLERFRAERRILARLEHPHIARILDGGETDEGLPYLVMQYIDGQSIDDYCDAMRASLRERLALFRTVCSAVDYAHRQLVVHRDIKPANVFVTAAGDVKLLDFGIGKLLESDDGNPTLTALDERAMTPAYASPEQIRGEPVGTASDVYTLGILLYELLAGRHPFAGRSAREIERAVLETDPQLPSTAATRDDETTSASDLADLRRTDPAHLQRDLEGDLDNVVRKAIDKDPERRYSTAGELADDIQRYLRSEPVLAHPPSAMYQIRKMVARNRAVTVFVALLATLLLGWTITSSVQLQSQRRERARAEAEAQKARRVVEFLDGMLASADPGVTGGKLEVAELLDIASRDLDTELEEQPEVRAALHNTIGNAYRALARYDDAQSHLERALGIRREVLGSEHSDVAETKADLAAFYAAARDRNAAGLAKADSLAREALATSRGAFEAHPERVVENLRLLGRIANYRGAYAAAESLQSEALVLAKQVHGDEHIAIAAALSDLAYAFHNQDKHDEGHASARQSLAIVVAHFGENHTRVSSAKSDLAYLLGTDGNYAAAESLYLDSIAIESRIRGEEHPAVATRLSNLGTVYENWNRIDEAEKLLRQALDIRVAALGESNYYVASTYNSLAIVLDKQGRHTESWPLFNRAYEIWRDNLGESHPDAVTALANLGASALNVGRDSLAAEIIGETLTSRIEIYGPSHIQTSVTRYTLATALIRLGEYDEAKVHIDSTLACWRRVFGERHGNITFCMINQAYIEQALGRLEKAESIFREALEIGTSAFGDTHPGVGYLRAYFGRALLDLGKHAQAGEQLDKALAVIEATTPRHFMLGEAQVYRADLLLEEANASEALEWAQRGHEHLAATLTPGHPRVLFARGMLAVCQAANGDRRALEDPSWQPALTHGGVLMGERQRLRDQLERYRNH